ncbi:hypothetical protein SRABI89_00631 [Pseudomonas koreensis]|nr:hypothetical protein SRABI89_00631 [Pseudomonas koreensis]
MTHRFREQARSHNGPGQGHNLQRNPNPCGSGLAREGARSDTSTLNDTPLSRAGSLPQWSGARSQSSAQPKSLWERACPRRRRHIQHHRLSHRYREQARSHNGPGQISNPCRNPNLCGSEPAREGFGTFNLIIACHTAIASKLAPTMVRGKSTIFSPTQIPVGAGLPAKASARSTSSSPDPPLSRAGSLPQWSGARSQSSAQPKSLWERACSRRGQIRYIHIE